MSSTIATQLGVEIPNQDLQVVIWDVIKDILKLFVEFVLCHVIRTVHRCINLSIGETGCDDLIVDGLPAKECFLRSFAQDKAYSTFVPFFLTHVQDGLAVTANSAICHPSDLYTFLFL